jgi:hypothetical protein
MEVLPLSNRYRLTYLAATQEKQSSSATVTYQTQLVTVELRDNLNALIQNSNAAIVWQPGGAGSYVNFGDGVLDANGTESMEVLPLSNRYRLTYGGQTKEKQTSATTVTYTWDGTNLFKIVEQGEKEVPASLLPTEFGLAQNYPNPFNPSTSIRIALPVDATVSLAVYNTLGQKVAELMSGAVSAGYHDVRFDATSLASGLYIYRMVANGTDGREFTKIQKMMLLR